MTRTANSATEMYAVYSLAKNSTIPIVGEVNVHLLMLAYGFRWFYGAIHFLKGNPDALTKEDVQKLNEASRINAEKDEAYWNGYWDGFIG